jgi:hypothetical protein
MSLDVSLYFPVDVGHDNPESHVVFSGNITHNLNEMASEAGIYECLWRPDEHGINEARQIVEPLAAGLADMEARPDHYRTFNPSNGWGTFDGFVKWCHEYLEACKKYPKASIYVSR